VPEVYVISEVMQISKKLYTFTFAGLTLLLSGVYLLHVEMFGCSLLLIFSVEIFPHNFFFSAVRNSQTNIILFNWVMECLLVF